MRKRLFTVWLAVGGLVSGSAMTAEDLGRFQPGDAKPPAPWELLRFDTRIPASVYRVRVWDSVPAVEGVSSGGMALLARPVAVDLAKTPVLCWLWRVDAPLQHADMQHKAGDDYAARLYLAFRLPAGSLGFADRARLAVARRLFGDRVPEAAINYVWDNRYPVGTRQPNVYTRQNRMWVLRTGARDAGRWVAERRDVPMDILTEFNIQGAVPVMLAIGTDTDNTGERSRAGFADLHFVARQEHCRFSLSLFEESVHEPIP